MKKKPFELPPKFLRQLDEYTSGGYILITMDPDGQPVVSQKFDNMIIETGMVNFLKSWACGISDVQDAMIHNHIMGEAFGLNEDTPDEDEE